MTPRFIGDLHLGHRNIYKYRPFFESTLHNDLFFMEVLNRITTKRDTMYFMGDIIFDKKYLQFIKELQGTKILIIGNHDRENCTIHELLTAFDDIDGIKKYKEFWLTHAPMHPIELRGKKNIHGHVHNGSIPDYRYINTSAESSLIKYIPRTLEEIRTAIKYPKVYLGMTPEEEELYKEERSIKEIYNRTLMESRKTTIIVTGENQ